MDEFRALLDRFWIVRRQDKELFHQVRQALPEMRRALRDQFGWELIRNERMIRLVKLPARPEACMGILEFSDTQDYCLLCALLLVLEDKDDGERFLLSELTQALETYTKPYLPDLAWEHYRCRISLVRVLRYANRLGLLQTCEGSSDNFATRTDQEVLYENTGLSRWFSVNFHQDISGYSSAEDFLRQQENAPDQERGVFRTYRVYRQLALAPAVYPQDAADPLYAYLKNQRGPIQKNLDEILGGNLQIYQSAAFFLPEEGARPGELFPKDQMLSDILLQLFERLREKVEAGELLRDSADCLCLPTADLTAELVACRQENLKQWGKSYAEKEPQQLLSEVLAALQVWGLGSTEGDRVILRPTIALWNGIYPKK